MAYSASEMTMEMGLRAYGSEFAKAMQPLQSIGGWKPLINEPFTGAWQRNEEIRLPSLTTYPTLYACIMRIVTDIGKLPYVLKSHNYTTGVWSTVTNPAYSPVLRKQNHYQTAQQFREAWMVSKLTQGNTYVLKERDNRGVVTNLYVLNPCRVQPMVSDSGYVFYELNVLDRSLLPENYGRETLVVPASEIIHDRCITLHHQLIGVPPLCAAYWPAVKNLKILKSSAEFFGNNAQPGGILTAPAGMSEADAQSIQQFWQSNYSGQNSGKIAVLGADMKFTSFAMKSADSQLVEQMRYSDEQVCQPFGIPPFKIGIGSIPAGMKTHDINLLYHSDALQTHIEAMENLLDDALNISSPLGIELDTDPLLRMDTQTRAATWGGLVKDALASPNEGRREFNLPPLEGGDTVYMQQQDYPLDQVRLNKIEQTPVAPTPTEPAPIIEDEQEQERQMIAAIRKAFQEAN